MKHSELQYSSPIQFAAREKLILAVIPPLASFAYKLLLRTSKLEVSEIEHWEQFSARKAPVIAAFWHETLGLAAWRFRNTGHHTLTSYSFDGELAARVVTRFGLEPLRGSSSRGGFEALGQLEKALALHESVGFTVDGPRGPRREAKPGVAILSVRTGTPIIPCAFGVNRAWRLNSWDGFVVPKPFARLVCIHGEPILPPLEQSPEAIETVRRSVENALNYLHTEIEKNMGRNGTKTT